LVPLVDEARRLWQTRLVIDRATASALVRTAAPELDAEAIVEEVQLGWRLVPSDEDEPAVRVGGPAPLLPDEAWPRNERGIPMTFLASVDTARVPTETAPWSTPAWGHRGGVLRIFADLVDEPYDCGPVHLSEAPAGARLRLVEAPPIPDPFPPGGPQHDIGPEERERELPLVRCSLEPLLTIPDTWDVSSDPVQQRAHDQRSAASHALRRGGPAPIDPSSATDAAHDRFDEPTSEEALPDEEVVIFGALDGPASPTGMRLGLEMRLEFDDTPGARPDDLQREDCEAMEEEPWAISHLLGFSAGVQGDPRWIGEDAFPELPGLETWQSLIAVHSGLGGTMDVADAGAYVVIVPVADLAQGRYDRGFLVLESH
jgi:hypothetical protein